MSFQDLESKCKCDCVSCVTGHHLGCYYTRPDGKPECPIARFFAVLVGDDAR